jgi:hypothetical protein
MIACAEARERIAPWLYGEIGAGERRALEEHLRACAACASDAERTRRALDLLAADDVPDPGPLYWSSFGDRLRARIAVSRRRARLLRLTAGIAAAAIVVAALALLEMRRGEPPGRAAGGRAGGALPAPAPRTGPEAPPTGSSLAEVRPAPRALSVEEAETRLREALERAAAEGQDPGEIETILDEIAPADSLEGAGMAGDLSPKEDRRLSDDLLDPRG